MNPRNVKSIADAKAIVEKRGLNYVKVGVFDIDGIMRGKYMSKEKFFSSLENGFGFCDVVVGWDSQDQLYDNASVTGWHTGYPDAEVRVLPETCREIAWENDMLFFLGEFSGKYQEVCPRGTLRRVLDRADKMGYKVKAGFEFEFFMFEETPHSVREKNYQNLKPIQPGHFGYSVLRNTVDSDIYRNILDGCIQMDMPLEGLHEETGPGVLEAAITVDEALAAADKASMFKTFAKIMAQKHGLMATFMAKWSPDWPGQSGHIHISLTKKSKASGGGKGIFYDAKYPDGMSKEMTQFVAGQQKLMPEFLSMIAPTVNSYTRLIPGFWAPTDSTWGVDNRTTALRVIKGSEKSQRVEYRVAAADCNPYLALAAAIASGLHGMEADLKPEPKIEGNAYEQTFPKRLALPTTLYEAAGRLKASKVARDMFGDTFVDHYAASREWEEREFRRHITDWEMQRYFEII